MTGRELKTYRKENALTQLEAARKLGVSQTYLSLLEAGKRPLLKRLERKAVRLFDLPPTEVPTKLAAGELPRSTDDQLAADLADLGYVGFGHLRRKRPRRKNPAEVLLSALNSLQRDARVMEGLPWLVVRYPDMHWDEVVRTAKLHDLQNRLGFVVSLAKEVAESRLDKAAFSVLEHCEAQLERSRLVREDTLCNEAMTKAERNWLVTERPERAKYWHLLTGLRPEHLSYLNAD